MQERNPHVVGVPTTIFSMFLDLQKKKHSPKISVAFLNFGFKKQHLLADSCYERFNRKDFRTFFK
ncbi:hypothetical protein A0128_04520 [Leptospira tipperaryensis]|uniref:Uncharacterized protein n=1 Tax=Leptospira tipperaryensis TaxID=2564040 RepID=A0A1D7UU90_9LEPT|nr:hypothetical protein A0128_04520 [Leptospira tipperaryensis]